MVEGQCAGIRAVFARQANQQLYGLSFPIHCRNRYFGINRTAIGPIITVLVSCRISLIIRIIVLRQAVAQCSATIVVIGGGTVTQREIDLLGTFLFLATFGHRTPLNDEGVEYSAKEELHAALAKIEELQA